MTSSRRGAAARAGRPSVLVTAGVVLAALLSACGDAPVPLTMPQAIQAGVAAQNSGKLALATSYYAKALVLRPRSAVVLFDLGDVEQRQGLTAVAESNYRAALATDPTFVPALYNLATLVASARPLESAALYREVVRLAPRDADAHFNLGLILRSLGHKVMGTAQINLAIALDPALGRRLAPTVSGRS